MRLSQPTDKVYNGFLGIKAFNANWLELVGFVLFTGIIKTG